MGCCGSCATWQGPDTAYVLPNQQALQYEDRHGVKAVCEPKVLPGLPVPNSSDMPGSEQQSYDTQFADSSDYAEKQEQQYQGNKQLQRHQWEEQLQQPEQQQQQGYEQQQQQQQRHDDQQQQQQRYEQQQGQPQQQGQQHASSPVAPLNVPPSRLLNHIKGETVTHHQQLLCRHVGRTLLLKHRSHGTDRTPGHATAQGTAEAANRRLSPLDAHSFNGFNWGPKPYSNGPTPIHPFRRVTSTNPATPSAPLSPAASTSHSMPADPFDHGTSTNPATPSAPLSPATSTSHSMPMSPLHGNSTAPAMHDVPMRRGASTTPASPCYLSASLSLVHRNNSFDMPKVGQAGNETPSERSEREWLEAQDRERRRRRERIRATSFGTARQ